MGKISGREILSLPSKPGPKMRAVNLEHYHSVVMPGLVPRLSGLRLVMPSFMPRLSGLNLVDKAHGIDSSVLQAFGDVLGHEEGSSHAASE